MKARVALIIEKTDKVVVLIPKYHSHNVTLTFNDLIIEIPRDIFLKQIVDPSYRIVYTRRTGREIPPQAWEKKEKTHE